MAILRHEIHGPDVEQNEALEYILIGDLRDLLDERPDEITFHWMCAVLDALLQTMPHESGGRRESDYLSEVLERYPSWHNQVDELERQKRELYAKLRELRRQVSPRGLMPHVAERISMNLRDWMSRVQAHHRHEHRLLQSAFNLDVGIGD